MDKLRRDLGFFFLERLPKFNCEASFCDGNINPLSLWLFLPINHPPSPSWTPNSTPGFVPCVSFAAASRKLGDPLIISDIKKGSVAHRWVQDFPSVKPTAKWPSMVVRMSTREVEWSPSSSTWVWIFPESKAISALEVSLRPQQGLQ